MSPSVFFKLLAAGGLRRIAVAFVTIFGLIWLFIEPAGLFLPERVNWGWRGYVGLVCVSLVFAVARNIPRTSFSRSFSSPDYTIEIKVGDLFDQPEHLVIGLNDVFDTELGEIIKQSSVQGQFLDRIYSGDRARLDAEIDKALQPLKNKTQQDLDKQRGKRWRYPIGTTLVLGVEGRRYFLSAYGRMGSDLRIQSTVDDIWLSLTTLWQQVRLRGHGKGVSIPIIGSDLARTGLSRMALAKLIMLSFALATKEGFVANRLTVMIRPEDLNSVDVVELQDFLDSTLS